MYYDIKLPPWHKDAEKPYANAESVLKQLYIKGYHRALTAAKCLPDNAVMIGDRLDNDIAPDKKVGMKTV